MAIVDGWRSEVPIMIAPAAVHVIATTIRKLSSSLGCVLGLVPRREPAPESPIAATLRG